MGDHQGLPMADDIVFELLHSEIINYAIDQSKEPLKDKKVLCFSILLEQIKIIDENNCIKLKIILSFCFRRWIYQSLST